MAELDQPQQHPGTTRLFHILRWVLVALLLVAAVGAWGRSWIRDHLATMLREPDAGLGSCTRCHAAEFAPRPFTAGPPTPIGLAVLGKGLTLVTAQRDGSVYWLEPATGRIRGRMDVGQRPHGIALLAEGREALVTLRDEDAVAWLDLEQRTVLTRIPVGREPTGVAVAPRHHLALVTNTSSDDISVIDLRSRQERYRLPAGREPYAIACSPDQRHAVVANRLSSNHKFGTPPASEATILALAETPRVVQRRMLPSLHAAEGVAITPDSQLALIPALATHNLIPITQVDRGWVTADALVVLELQEPSRTIPILIDDAHDYHADPAEITIAADGRRAYLAVGGRDRVIAIDLPRLNEMLAQYSSTELGLLGTNIGPGSRLVRERIGVQANPRGLAIEGDRLYVVERLADSVAAFSLPEGRLLQRIALGPPGPPSIERRGEQLFYRATAYQGQFSCRSCHPDGHLDGLAYDFEIDGVGQNIVDNRSLRGLPGTAPYKWTGVNPTLETQCGVRFDLVLSRSGILQESDLQAMRKFIDTIPTVQARRTAPLTPEQQLGRTIFYRERTNDGQPIPVQERCSSCHPAPTFTSQTRSRVGTATAGDSTEVFDSSHLLDIAYGAPYLHDGRVATLMELFVDHNPEDRHGRTSDLTRVQLNALVEYLKSL